MGQTETKAQDSSSSEKTPEIRCYHRIRFRSDSREFTIQTCVDDLKKGDAVMVKTDHGLEPAIIVDKAPDSDNPEVSRHVTYYAPRRTTQEEEEKYARLPLLEEEGFAICNAKIAGLNLPMNLVKVERFFNGSKIIFYFTAESRVDFRELVKQLVQEFRTRVEMRQVGVRHETQMTGGIGPCGRELCCSSFLKHFDSVSIKMAKTQDLPLNPAKISGLCNRLLCCLTYEYPTYRDIKKKMPKVGKFIRHDNKTCRVVRLMPLHEAVAVITEEGEELILSEQDWQKAQPVQRKPKKRSDKKQK